MRKEIGFTLRISFSPQFLFLSRPLVNIAMVVQSVLELF